MDTLIEAQNVSLRFAAPTEKKGSIKKWVLDAVRGRVRNRHFLAVDDVSFSIRRGETVSCRYDDDMKRQLTERLTLFKNCLEEGNFPAAEAAEDGEDPCRYCKYQAVCGKISELSDAEEG